jgi:hypothetical protein
MLSVQEQALILAITGLAPKILHTTVKLIG